MAVLNFGYKHYPLGIAYGSTIIEIVKSKQLV
jgi:hypothetical protein